MNTAASAPPTAPCWKRVSRRRWEYGNERAPACDLRGAGRPVRLRTETGAALGQRRTGAQRHADAGRRLETRFNEHIYTSKEAASGGSAVGGGGCGCN
ncbi:DUF4266 domain-containing protein [Massilia eburnea]|uniref:DUF4266 domain-containing protein n=1 Tax=Massilia eburnea TaxID=1776165 RepID=UPI003D6B559E